MYDPEYSLNDNEHGWLDKNGWESRKTYVLQDGVIYEAYLRIAKAKDGRNIKSLLEYANEHEGFLYQSDDIKKLDNC